MGSFREDGISLYREGRYSAALELFIAEGADPVQDPEPSYYMGLCHVRLGEYEEAKKLFKTVLESDQYLPRVYQTHMLLTWLLVESEEIEAAEKCAAQVLRRGFESPQAWSALGYCQWRRGNTGAALESYREAVNLDDDNPTAANGLGYLLAESGEDPERAVELCRLAVERDAANMAYKDSLGWALFRAGRPSEAVSYLTEALTKRPKDELIQAHLEAVRTHYVDH